MAQLRTSLPASESPHGASIPRAGSNELTVEEVRFAVSADDIERLDDGIERFDIIGQPRALRALRLAIDIEGKGYNIFATGLAGTGKRTAIMRILKEYRPGKRHPLDIAYVHNFKQADRPRVLYFAPGEAAEFRTRVSQVIDVYRRVLGTLPFHKGYKQERDRLMLQAEGRETQAVTEFEQKINAEGFEIVQIDEKDDQRADIAPIFQGQSASFDDLQRMVSKGEIQEKVWSEIREKYYRFIDEMKQIFHSLQTERSDVEESLRALQIDLIRPEIEAEVARIRLDFPDARVHHYLDGLVEDLFEHMNWFRSEDAARDETNPPQMWRYGVNVIVDHSETQGAPVIFESHPDYQKLFGSQDAGGDSGGERISTFMQLRAGSLLQASGGFLIMRAEDILGEEDAWNSLKSALQDGNTEIRSAPGPFGQGPSLKPEPVEIAVKVIVMGSEHIYDYLYNVDEEFQKLFKVPAEFDSVMLRNDTSTREYIGFMRMICRDEGLRKIDHDGISAVVEFGVRLSEFRDRLSTQFSRIADLIREADYWAGREHRGRISREDVERALLERKFLYDLPEEKIDEQILSGELLISVKDSAVGRINGLAVIDRGYYGFARPILISARVSPGTDGIINVERESGLSGEIHDKGVYILEGFLQSTYAQSFPLSINASVAFEQSYVEVDGDSASSTEIYVILSAIANIPLRQDIAVSGSVNQMGQIQPVGGISEKVEGFYEICKKIGLTGTQGVIMPRQNLPNLILNRELQQAVADGQFHIYTAETIDEGFEILTGMKTGSRGPKGNFPAGSTNTLVERRLHEMAELVKEFGSD
jgi:predicted ATP-dependent protease